MDMAVELPELLVADAEQWRSWLEENHATSPGVRLVLHKKGGTVTALTYDGALDEALSFGWIDGVIGRRDEGSYLTRFTPRRARSKWSMNNVVRIGRLEQEARCAGWPCRRRLGKGGRPLGGGVPGPGLRAGAGGSGHGDPRKIHAPRPCSRC